MLVSWDHPPISRVENKNHHTETSNQKSVDAIKRNMWDTYIYIYLLIYIYRYICTYYIDTSLSSFSRIRTKINFTAYLQDSALQVRLLLNGILEWTIDIWGPLEWAYLRLVERCGAGITIGLTYYFWANSLE